MRLIVDQSLVAGFIPINILQQRASLPFKPGVMERKVYNNDDKTFFSVLTFAKPKCDLLHPELLRGEGCNTLSNLCLANINIHKRMFYPLINKFIYLTGPDKQNLGHKIMKCFLFALNAQRSRLNETVLFSTHNICYGYLFVSMLYTPVNNFQSG